MYITLPLSFSFQDFPEQDEWAVLVYFQGCDRNCYNCHNPESQKQELTDVYVTAEELHELLQTRTHKCRTNNVVLTGGDPLMERQLPELRRFLKKYGFEPYNICVYTGASKKEIISKIGDIKSVCYIKGGHYEFKNKTKSTIGKTKNGFQLASENQFILDTDHELLTVNGYLSYE